MKTLLTAAALATLTLVPLAAADGPQCYWESSTRAFVWEMSMHTVYLEDDEPLCTASVHPPIPLCGLAPRDAISTWTFYVLTLEEDCTHHVGEPRCHAGGEWPNCL